MPREVTYWKRLNNESTNEAPQEPTWRGAANRPGLDGEFIISSWVSRFEKGLGDDWMEKKGYEQVSELIRPNEYVNK